MKATIKFALLALLTSLLLVGIASAVTSTPASVILTIGSPSQIVTLSNTNTTDSETITSLGFSTATLTDGTNTATLSVSGPTPFTLNPSGQSGSTATRTISISGADLSAFKFGSYSSTLSAVSSLGSNASVPITFAKGFCSNGPIGNNISVTGVDISNSGDDDETWMPLDTVKVDVDFENTGDEDLKDIYIEFALYDSNGKKKTGDLTFINSDEEKIDYGRLDSGDDDTVTFEFQVAPDMDEGSYRIAVKAYSDDTGQAVDCDDNGVGEDIDVEKQSDSGEYIAFDDIVISPEQATCGDTVTLNFKAYNVGDEDQDRVKITMKNTELGFSDTQEITGGMDMGDNVEISSSFVIPAGVKDKTYSIALDADYDYNKGTYRDGLDSEFVNSELAVKVIGCTPVVTKIASVSAQMESDTAEAGKELVITATVTNPGTASATYDVSAKNSASWADSVELSSDSFTLAAGASKDVTLTFQVADDAEGEQSFDFQVSSGEKTESKEIAVDIAAQSTGLSGMLAGKSTLFWIIIAANVILIILIIIVAVRLASK